MADEIQNPATQNSELQTENSELDAQNPTPNVGATEESSHPEADSSPLTADPPSGPLALDPGSPANSSAGVVDPGPSSSPEPFRLESPPTPTPADPKKTAPKKDPEEASQSPFTVTVGQVYDGPFDLLLDLIRKQNIDIYDIPIARITAQFLEYTRHLQQTDVDSAGEFVYTASLLIHIKSRMLLPRDPKELGDLGNAEDPRRELVERLLEHERFKAAAQMLQQNLTVEAATFTNPGIYHFHRDEAEAAGEVYDPKSVDDSREIAADATDLIRVFREVLQRLRERPVHTIDEDTVTVGQMIDYVKRRLTMEDKPVSLRKLLANTRSERALICTFLAMLELVRLQAILLRQPEQLGDILIKKADRFDEVMSDNTIARDDWS